MSGCPPLAWPLNGPAQHLAAGRVHVDGEIITGLDPPAPEPARVVLQAP